MLCRRLCGSEEGLRGAAKDKERGCGHSISGGAQRKDQKTPQLDGLGEVYSSGRW